MLRSVRSGTVKPVLTPVLFFFREAVGPEFQEDLSDMLLLKMLRSATQASGDKDRVGGEMLSTLIYSDRSLLPCRCYGQRQELQNVVSVPPQSVGCE